MNKIDIQRVRYHLSRARVSHVTIIRNFFRCHLWVRRLRNRIMHVLSLQTVYAPMGGLLPPPWRRLCFHRCPLLCLFVFLSVSNIAEKTAERIFMTFSGLVGLDTRNNWDNVHDVPFNPLDTGIFPHFFEGIHAS